MSKARRPLFAVVSGDVRQELLKLIAAGAPTAADGILRKAQVLMKLGMPVTAVAEAFELIGEAP